VPHVASSSVFTRILQDYMAAYPKVNIELTLISETVHPVNDGFDLVLSSQPLEEKSLESRALAHIKIGAFAAPDLAKTLLDVRLIDALHQCPFILSPGFTAQDWSDVFSTVEALDAREFSFRLRCNDISVAHGLCAAGKGIAVLPVCRAENDLQSGRLEKVLPDLSFPPLRFYASWPRAARDTSLTRRFVDNILLEFGGENSAPELPVTE
ncbi:MAG: hypothetical protein GY947_07175, partial [Rhodobacteraceae bacterium]|nr:hypothetical protein [Paracoccaceae bacterium]